MREQTAAIVTDYWPDLGNGLNDLIKAFRYAADTGVSIWQFAISDSILRQRGMSELDLRWLVLRGLADCRIEITRPGDNQRVFTDEASPNHATAGCFVLTEQGFMSLEGVAVQCCCEAGGESHRSSSRMQPHWDAVRHELRLNGKLIKRYRTPAPNQERILSAFQEDNWAPRIEDPLPPAREQNPKQRLHDTIRSLNRAHHSPLIRFVGDGTGQGVLWMQCDGNGRS